MSISLTSWTIIIFCNLLAFNFGSQLMWVYAAFSDDYFSVTAYWNLGSFVLFFWSSVTVNNAMVCAPKWVLSHLDGFLCSLNVYLYVSYMLAGILVTLWYQTSVFREPNPAFFWLTSANRTNRFFLFWKWEKKIILVFWCMALWIHGLGRFSSMLWLSWSSGTIPFHPETGTML